MYYGSKYDVNCHKFINLNFLLEKNISYPESNGNSKLKYIITLKII